MYTEAKLQNLRHSPNTYEPKFTEMNVDTVVSRSYLHYASYLLHFTLSWEERIACVQFSKDATKTPHVNGHAVGMTEDDLWRAIEATLDVGVH